jgi:hypothetical protein
VPGHGESAVIGGTGPYGAVGAYAVGGEGGAGEGGAGEGGAGGRPAGRGAARGRRRVVAGGWAAGVGIGFVVYLRLASTRAVNSDGAAQALQAWDMLHGNLLLRGWTTSDVSFYTTELPQYLMIEAVRGLGQDVVHIAAAMTYTLVVAAAALLAAGQERGLRAVTRGAVTVGIMLAPQLGSGTNVLLSSPDHVGTSVPLLLAWLVLDRGRPGWRVPLVTSALLAWAAVADSIVLMAGIIPLALVCALRAGRALGAGKPRAGRLEAGWLGASRPGASRPGVSRPGVSRPGVSRPGVSRPGVSRPGVSRPGVSRPGVSRPGVSWHESGWYEAVVGGGAVVAAGVADLALRAIHAAGGFSVRPLGVQVASAGEIFRHNLPVVGQCLLLLPGADFLGLGGGVSTLFVFLHLAGACAAGAGIVLAARRPGRLDLVSQVLLAAIAVDLAGFALTDRVYAVSSAREIAPVLPFAAALAGRLLGGPLLRAARAGLRPGTGPRETVRLSDADTRADGVDCAKGPAPSGSIARKAPIEAAESANAPRPWQRARRGAPGSRRGFGARLAVAGAGCLLGAGYVAGLGVELATAGAPAQDAALTSWLERHQLGTGLSGYWEASVVTLASGGRVAVRPVSVAGGRVGPAVGEVRADWFAAGVTAGRCASAHCLPAHCPPEHRPPAHCASAHYVVLFPGVPGYPGFADQGAVTATFGRPARVYHVGRYQVWYWRANLLSSISH